MNNATTEFTEKYKAAISKAKFHTYRGVNGHALMFSFEYEMDGKKRFVCTPTNKILADILQKIKEYTKQIKSQKQK